MKKSITIPDAELEVIEVLWETEEPMSAFEIRQKLFHTKRWERTTVLTLIRRLVEKNLITQEKKDVYYYTPNIKKEEYVKTETHQFIQKLYKGKSKNLIAALFQDDNLSKEDIEELKHYLNQEGEEYGK